MSDSPEVIQLDDGGLEIPLGLNLPDETELALMAESPVYPESRLLENGQIQRALTGEFYKQSRAMLAPWMINQNPLGKCNASALKGALRADSAQPRHAACKLVRQRRIHANESRARSRIRIDSSV